MHRIRRSALLPLNLETLLSSVDWFLLYACVYTGFPRLGGKGRQSRAGTEQLTWGLTFDPVLERDSVSPATQYFQHAVLRGCLLLSTIKPIAGVSLGRKAPRSADCHPEVFHHFSALYLRPWPRKRGKTQ